MKKSALTSVISTITMARHGKAPSVLGKPDSERVLGELGLQQAGALKAKLKDHPVDLVVSSPLVRAVDTISIATGKPKTDIILLAALGCSDDPADPLNIMYNELGYVPLITDDLEKPGYFQHELTHNLKDYGHMALKSVIAVSEEASRRLGGRPIHVIIGGHAVCQNALAWALCEQLEQDGPAAQLVTRTSLGEAEAFRFDLTGAEIACEHIK